PAILWNDGRCAQECALLEARVPQSRVITSTQCDAIVQAPAPSRPIERGIAGPGLLARVLTSKYAEHTPLYRQSEI
ncbi:IS66 family transposase, partial [Escherichia coli]|uniref:IS66 family transposase n=1 Tax=Escherichia coli TaxID=562 RepID=UPI002FBDFCD3